MLPDPLANPLALVGTTFEGKFRIDAVVAEGGFGYVFSAEQIVLERRIAIKVLKTPPAIDDAALAEFNDAFAREAKTIARINHPGVVQVLDYGVAQMPGGRRPAPW